MTPARAAPSSAASRFTINLVGMAAQNADNRPLLSKRARNALCARNPSIFCCSKSCRWGTRHGASPDASTIAKRARVPPTSPTRMELLPLSPVS